MTTSLTGIPPAPSALARKHFAAELAFQTDCSDAHEALRKGADFVLLDVCNPALFAQGHIKGAINLPHGKIVRLKMEEWPQGTVFVTYCAGPHCNGAAGGALRLAQLERPVKVTAGGVVGWLHEGFDLVSHESHDMPSIRKCWQHRIGDAHA